MFEKRNRLAQFGIVLATALSLTLPLSADSVNRPIILSTTVDTVNHRITITGIGLAGTKSAPSVLFDAQQLTVNTFTTTQIVAALPAAPAPGTYLLLVNTEQNQSSNAYDTFNVTVGAAGAQGRRGRAGIARPSRCDRTGRSDWPHRSAGSGRIEQRFCQRHHASSSASRNQSDSSAYADSSGGQLCDQRQHGHREP